MEPPPRASKCPLPALAREERIWRPARESLTRLAKIGRLAHPGVCGPWTEASRPAQTLGPSWFRLGRLRGEERPTTGRPLTDSTLGSASRNAAGRRLQATLQSDSSVAVLADWLPRALRPLFRSRRKRLGAFGALAPGDRSLHPLDGGEERLQRRGLILEGDLGAPPQPAVGPLPVLGRPIARRALQIEGRLRPGERTDRLLNGRRPLQTPAQRARDLRWRRGGSDRLGQGADRRDLAEVADRGEPRRRELREPGEGVLARAELGGDELVREPLDLLMKKPIGRADSAGSDIERKTSELPT